MKDESFGQIIFQAKQNAVDHILLSKKTWPDSCLLSCPKQKKKKSQVIQFIYDWKWQTVTPYHQALETGISRESQVFLGPGLNYLSPNPKRK